MKRVYRIPCFIKGCELYTTGPCCEIKDLPKKEDGMESGY